MKNDIFKVLRLQKFLSMQIEDTDARAVIRYFRSVNPNMKDSIISWKKGMPIELNVIYSYNDSKNRCIAMWTDFFDMNISPERLQIIFGRISLLDCEFFMYHNNKRFRIGFRVKEAIK